ncbi:peptidoglycan-binding domain-containing protein [Vibrio cortegadensis]|uniref:peptidoglycan-binding domain-containing protein n=1 Tax=Vibrio cortegadensis TaxID=1328770 RepID=UPI00352E5264
MNKVFICLLVSFSFISIQSASATSGRTNSSGCHNSKKIGYHCHGTPNKSKSSYQAPVSSIYDSTNRNTLSKKNLVKNDLVKGVQIQLNRLGYSVGREDGILGEKTSSAIKKFQRSNSFYPDGLATSNLLLQLVLVKG